MAVVRLGFLIRFVVFEQLSGFADSGPAEPGERGFALREQRFVEPEFRGGFGQVQEAFANQLEVHAAAAGADGRGSAAFGIEKTVFGRGGRRSPECAAFIPGQQVERECGAAAQERIGFAQKLEIPGKAVIFADMAAEPESGDRPVRPARLARRRIREAPEVAVVVQTPAARVIKPFRRLLPRLGGFAQKAEQRLGAFGQVGGQRRPVVHFEVDVRRVIASPRRQRVPVPDALKIGGLGTGAARCEQQIAPVVVEQCGERGGGGAGAGGQPFVGRQRVGGVLRQFEA